MTTTNVTKQTKVISAKQLKIEETTSKMVDDFKNISDEFFTSSEKQTLSDKIKECVAISEAWEQYPKLINWAFYVYVGFIVTAIVTINLPVLSILNYTPKNQNTINITIELSVAATVLAIIFLGAAIKSILINQARTKKAFLFGLVSFGILIILLFISVWLLPTNKKSDVLVGIAASCLFFTEVGFITSIYLFYLKLFYLKYAPSFSRNTAKAEIVSEILICLTKLSSNNSRRISFDVADELVPHFKILAKYFAKDLFYSLPSIYNKQVEKSYRQSMNRVAERYKDYQIWVATPGETTWTDLFKALSNDLKRVLNDNWDALISKDTTTKKTTLRMRLQFIVKSVVFSVLYALTLAVPLGPVESSKPAFEGVFLGFIVYYLFKAAEPESNFDISSIIKDVFSSFISKK